MKWRASLQQLRESWRRSRRSGRSPQPLRLERLEDRTVPTIVFQPNNVLVAKNVTTNGPVLAKAQIELIFWGKGWMGANGQPIQLATDTIAGAQSIISGPYMSHLSQYNNVGNATLDPKGAYYVPDNLKVTNDISQPDIEAFLRRTLANTNLKVPVSAQNVYFVVPQPGSTVKTNGMENYGFHAAIAYNNVIIHYGTAGNPTKLPIGVATPLDFLTDVFSHEMVETVTDPENNAWQVSPYGGMNELCDNNAKVFTYRVGGYLVQSYWSNAETLPDGTKTGAFVVPDGTTQLFVVYVEANSGSTGRVLDVKGDQKANKDDTITLAVAQGGGVQVTLNDETVTFEPYVFGARRDRDMPVPVPYITAMRVTPGQGTNTVTLANLVTNPKVVPVTIGGTNGDTTAVISNPNLQVSTSQVTFKDVTTLKINGGTLNVVKDKNVTVKNLDLSAGTLTGAGVLTASGTSTWSGGTMSGTGTTFIGRQGATLTIKDQPVTLDQRTLENYGTVTINGMGSGLTMTNKAVLKNTDTIHLDNDAGIQQVGEGATIKNMLDNKVGHGPVFRKTSGDGVSVIAVDFITVEQESKADGVKGTFQFTGKYEMTDKGKLNLDDNKVSTYTGTVQLDNGGRDTALLFGSGTIDGSLINSGFVRPGTTDAAGKITVKGTYTQTDKGTLYIFIGGPDPGTGYSQLQVNGTATVDGTLNVRQPFKPDKRQDFTVLTGNGVTGKFKNLNGLTQFEQVLYQANAVLLHPKDRTKAPSGGASGEAPVAGFPMPTGGSQAVVASTAGANPVTFAPADAEQRDAFFANVSDGTAGAPLVGPTSWDPSSIGQDASNPLAGLAA